MEDGYNKIECVSYLGRKVMVSIYQPRLFDGKALAVVEDSYRERLVQLLSGDLDFHKKDSGYATHNFHSFPAKFPPQLPRTFIQGLTARGDVVLDPMMGSGTTVVEAFCTGRRAFGFDIDPLALLITQVKVTSQDAAEIREVGRWITVHKSNSGCMKSM
jgi:hypothetical protein